MSNVLLPLSRVEACETLEILLAEIPELNAVIRDKTNKHNSKTQQEARILRQVLESVIWKLSEELGYDYELEDDNQQNP